VPSAADIIRLLELKPHPEGGHFRQTFRDTRTVDGTRAASTAIYFLLARGERSHWHRVDAVEAWHYHAGAPLRLEIAADKNGAVDRVTLGPDLSVGQRPQAIVPAHVWQAAQSLGDWTLVSCTVAPGFEFEGFELAPRGCTHTRYWPPFAVSVEPVMKPASSDARNRTQRAISSGSPSRPSGICGRMLFSSTSLGTALTISVAI